MNWIKSLRERFALNKASRESRGHGNRRQFAHRNSHGTIVNAPRECPSKQNPCICGNGRKYGKCCKRGFSLARALVRAGDRFTATGIADELQEKLAAWRLAEAKKRVHLL